eukprot:554169_1
MEKNANIYVDFVLDFIKKSNSKTYIDQEERPLITPNRIWMRKDEETKDNTETVKRYNKEIEELENKIGINLQKVQMKSIVESRSSKRSAVLGDIVTKTLLTFESVGWNISYELSDDTHNLIFVKKEFKKRYTSIDRDQKEYALITPAPRMTKDEEAKRNNKEIEELENKLELIKQTRLQLKNKNLSVRFDDISNNLEFQQMTSYFLQILSLDEKSIEIGVSLNDKTNEKHLFFVKDKTGDYPTSVKELGIGSKCEIYSNSQKQWFIGEIIHTFNDEQGQWLKVKYGNSTVKEIQKHSNNLRVSKCTIVQRIYVWKGEGLVAIPIDDKRNELYNLGLYESTNAENMLGNSKGIAFRILKDKNQIPPKKK